MAEQVQPKLSSSSEASSSTTTESDNDSDGSQGFLIQNGSGAQIKMMACNKKDTEKSNETAVCLKCGAMGLRSMFYSKAKVYCSYGCASTSPNTPNAPNTGGKTSSAQLKTTKRPTGGGQAGKIKKKKKIAVLPEFKTHFTWKSYLSKPLFEAAPVSCFKHAVLSDSWDNVIVGMKLEVENKDCQNFGNLFPNYYWIATVIKIAGYMARLRYEGFGTDESKDFWINLCKEPIHSVGWCASQGKPLIPPKTIEHKHADWKGFLVKRLTGARTLPSNFPVKVQEGLKSRFKFGMKLEVVDKNRISCVRVATVHEIMGGRLHITYEQADEGDEGFWCHERSPLLHPIGWAQIVGHDLRASLEYAKKSLQKALEKKFDPADCTWDMFMPVKNPPSELKFKEGMKLEAIDPLNLSTICVATVTRVLRNNFLMIGIDGMMAENGSDWFCYHASSPHIFPVGFCELNNIHLTPPRGHNGVFNWFEYLSNTKSAAAPVSLFKKELPNHGFKEGMHVEAVDLMEPRLICAGKVTRVVGRLLRVHFEGWDISYDQWCDCESPDLFPVGWCQLVGYRLEAPRVDDLEAKKKRKLQIYKGPRRKKKKVEPAPPRPPKKVDVKRNPANPQTFVNPAALNHPGGKKGISSSSVDEIIRPQIQPMKNLAMSGLAKSGLALGPTESNDPKLWNTMEVAQFLRINECGAYCQIFSHQRIDGAKFLSMSKDDVMSMTGMKVGPSLKIYDLIQQLQSKHYKI